MRLWHRKIEQCIDYRDKPLFPSIEDFDVLVKRVRQLEEYIKSNGTLSSGQGMLERSISVDRRSLGKPEISANTKIRIH